MSLIAFVLSIAWSLFKCYCFSLAQAEHSSVVKAQCGYDAAAQGELFLKENQTLLLVFGESKFVSPSTYRNLRMTLMR
jgi:hypothetical protein